MPVEPALSLLNGLADLVLKACDLAGRGRLGDDAFFDTVLRPMFDEVDAVVQDYVAIFDEAEAALAAAETGDAIAEAARALGARRRTALKARATLGGGVEALLDRDCPPDLERFLRGVATILFPREEGPLSEARWRARLSRSNRLRGMMERADFTERGDLLEAVRLTQREVEAGFVAVCEAYARLRIARCRGGPRAR